MNFKIAIVSVIVILILNVLLSIGLYHVAVYFGVLPAHAKAILFGWILFNTGQTKQNKS